MQYKWTLNFFGRNFPFCLKPLIIRKTINFQAVFHFSSACRSPDFFLTRAFSTNVALLQLLYLACTSVIFHTTKTINSCWKKPVISILFSRFFPEENKISVFSEIKFEIIYIISNFGFGGLTDVCNIYHFLSFRKVWGIHCLQSGNVPEWLPSSSAPVKAPDGQTAASWHSGDCSHPEYTEHLLYCHGPRGGKKRNSNDMSCQMRTTDSFSSSSALIAFFEGSSSVHQSVLALHMNTSVAATDNYITAFLHKTR